MFYLLPFKMGDYIIKADFKGVSYRGKKRG